MSNEASMGKPLSRNTQAKGAHVIPLLLATTSRAVLEVVAMRMLTTFCAVVIEHADGGKWPVLLLRLNERGEEINPPTGFSSRSEACSTLFLF